jgi:hypothetical protein
MLCVVRRLGRIYAHAANWIFRLRYICRRGRPAMVRNGGEGGISHAPRIDPDMVSRSRRYGASDAEPDRR